MSWFATPVESNREEWINLHFTIYQPAYVRIGAKTALSTTPSIMPIRPTGLHRPRQTPGQSRVMTITLKSLSSLTSYWRRCILRHQPHRPRRLGFLFHLAAFPRAEASEVGGTGALETD